VVPNIVYAGPAAEGTWRRIAIASWDASRNPQIYGFLDLDARGVRARVDEFQSDGIRVSETHVVAKACAVALARHPDLNVVLRRGRAWRRDSVDVFLQVVSPSREGLGATELSGVKIEGADRIPLPDLAQMTMAKVWAARRGRDEAINRTRASVGRVPRRWLRPMLKITRRLMVESNFDLSAFGIDPDPFGSIAISHVGSLGVDSALAPIYPIGGPPIQLTVSRVRDQAVVVDGEVVPRAMLRIGGTFDHRVVDGYHVAVLAKELRKLLGPEIREL
jgi:pyruvate dehydrogenase E2 component (dihydrolipoamide acetyltransferase)